MYTYYISVGSNIGIAVSLLWAHMIRFQYILKFIGLLVPPLWRQNLGAI